MQYPWLADRVRIGRKSAPLSDLEALRSYGSSSPMGNGTFYSGFRCGSKNGILALIHYLYGYENHPNPSDAIVEDVNIGGNSNARSIALATILCAWRGTDFPRFRNWIHGLKERAHIQKLLEHIP
jgi:hypothetical protein